MGDNSKADNEVVESSLETSVSQRQGFYSFMSDVEGEVFCITISIQILGEEKLQDRAIDIQTDLDDAIQRVVVGNNKLAPVNSGTTYQSGKLRDFIVVVEGA